VVPSGFSPNAVGRRTPSPVAAGFSVDAPRGPAPLPALARFAVGFDRRTVVDLAGIPTCDPLLQIRTPDRSLRRCRKAVVATGEATVAFHFPETTVPPVSGQVELINGGQSAGTKRLFAQIWLGAPVSGAAILVGELRRPDHGPFGTILEFAVPKIAGGFGGIVSFDLEFPKDLPLGGIDHHPVRLDCPNGRVRSRGWILLAGGESGSEEVVRSCTASGS
jgi:hypothetical protein